MIQCFVHSDVAFLETSLDIYLLMCVSACAHAHVHDFVCVSTLHVCVCLCANNS